MKITEDFIKIIDEDIKICEEFKNGLRPLDIEDYHNLLSSKYAKIIEGFNEGLYSTFYDTSNSAKLANIESMRQKLILFKAMGYENYVAKKAGNITFNNNNQLNATITVSFSDAKKQVEEMTSLKDEEIDEIQAKIDELEAIVNSADRKTKKWDKAKEIIKWVADKGIDVGLTLLPLILKLGE